MAPWTALNIEPESDEEDVEYDNTKELQIEEALKLYQTALKLHSQGPQYYEQADQAYKTLFESEIFRYPESRSELIRLLETDANDQLEDEAIELAPDFVGGGESAPSTLPQILYLSFKNRGQFLLDGLVRNLQSQDESTSVLKDTKEVLVKSLHLLSDALDKDSSDRDLWRRLAKLGHSIGSERLARFALESAVADEEAQNETSLLDGFDLDALALQQELRKTLAIIERDTQESRPGRNLLAESFSAQLDSLNRLPFFAKSTLEETLPKIVSRRIAPSAATWEAIGQAILDAKEAQAENDDDFVDYNLNLPDTSKPTSMHQHSPKLVTSESLSKRRFSKSPVKPFKQLPSIQAAARTDSLEADAQSLEDALRNTTISPTTTGAQETKTSTIPSKRSSESAGLQDNVEGTRSRSKRLRARAETIAEDVPDQKAVNKQIEEALGVYSRADDWVFNVAYEIGCRFGSKSIGSADTIREAIVTDSDSAIEAAASSDPSRAALHDFRTILATWSGNRSNLLLNGTGAGASAVLIDDGSDSSFTSFMERSKTDTRKSGVYHKELIDQGVSDWYSGIKSTSQDLEQIALDWIKAVLEPQEIPGNGMRSFYLHSIWSTQLKDYVQQILVDFDETVYAYIVNYESVPPSNDADSLDGSATMIGLIQAIFEIHIDAFRTMVAPDSKTDQPSRLAQRDRLRRWALLASIKVGDYAQAYEDDTYTTSLILRQLWAQVFYVGLVEVSARDHISHCHQDLQRVFEISGCPSYVLPNNSAIPEVSLDALKQELLHEKTLDFLQGIFGTESKDPVTLIESLEPLLMQTFNNGQLSSDTSEKGSSETQVIPDSDEDPASSKAREGQTGDRKETARAGNTNPQLIDFINKATVQLKLSLWHQLKGAYNRIDYPGMKVICNFRSMILILRELHSTSFAQEPHDDRAANLIIWLRNLVDLVSQTLDTIRSHAKALDCLAEEDLDLALEACALTLRLFHVFALWEDSIRSGQMTQPTTPGNANTYKNAMNFLREVQPKVWHLLYLIYREAFSQNPSMSEEADNDLIELIKAIHCAFGNREYCRIGRKTLMKFIKSELLRMNGPEEEIAQALYDLYGLKITTNPNTVWEHNCGTDTIDRTSALEIVEYVMSQALSMNIKDLLKSDIRSAVEKMQAVIGIPRAGNSTTQQSFNRRLVTNYLKSPVTKTQLQRSMRGLEGLSTMSIRTDYASVASKRWFFLVGWIHLTKYKTTKRVGPNNTEDLDSAITFLKLDLDFDSSSWETWLRLGQAFDFKLDEEVLWSASVINEKPEDLVQWERSAIHCYEMAISLATQHADDSRETQHKLAELYADFANRLYSSSRSPFNAKVFDVSGHVRYINQAEKGTYLVPALIGMSLSDIWTLCDRLYQRALDEKLEDDWFIWYMRSKCRWKLYQNRDNKHINWSSPIDAIQKSIKSLPGKKDSRHTDREPILEPHYKLLSITRKLVDNKVITLPEGVKILEGSFYAKKLKIEDYPDWASYTGEFLQVLRTADKSNWHHRMIAKAAAWAYDDHSHQIAAAQACKDKLSQHMLTKTMAIQIWKPEYERPGRHFVYATKYVSVVINLLEQLGERSSLEVLGKRIRKKQNEYIDPVDIFDKACEAHMRLVRQQGDIPEKSEERVFHNGMTFEYFVLNATRLETWAHSQLSLTNTTLPLLTEIFELKKLSGSLLEKLPFEELMMDIYACLFENVVPELITRAGEAENRERMRIDRMLLDNDNSAQVSASEAPAAPSRAKQISKTEVKRRAEGLVTKIVLPAVKAKAATAREATPEAISRGKGLKEMSARPSRGSSADAESELSSVPDSDMEEPNSTSKSATLPRLKARTPSIASDSNMGDADVSKIED